MIIKRIIVGNFMTNCYILGCERTRKAVIIDPGADSEKIISEINSANLIPIFIILTHAHGDHIGSVEELKTYYNIPVYVHEDDNDMLMNSNLNLTKNITGEEISIIADKLLKDKDIITLGDLKIEVLHVPGHTKGGIALKCNNIIFSGDVLFNNSIGRTDFIGSSYEKLISSIEKELMIYPNDTMVYPGHGLDTTIGKERFNNPFFSK